MTHTHPSPSPGTAVPAALLATAATLHGTTAHLPALPLGDPLTLPAWVDAHGPAVAAVSLVHAAAAAGCLYLAAIWSAHLAARRGRRTGLQRAADRLTAPALRPLLRASLGVSVIGAPALSVPAGDVELATMEPARAAARMVPTHESDTAATPSTTIAPSTPAEGADSPWRVEPRQPLAVEPPPATWTVADGESFWTIATELVDGPAVHSFWHALVSANRDRLVDPDDPDLLLPGQVLEVPTVR